MGTKALLGSDMDRGRSVAVIVAMLVAGAIWALTMDGPGEFEAYEVADSTADWLVTRAVLDGGDPYANIQALAQANGTSYVVMAATNVESVDFVHPRPPAALLLQVPFTLVPTRILHVLVVMSITGAIGVLILLSQRIVGAPVWLMYAGILVAVLARPTKVAVLFGVQSGIIALLVVAGWHSTRHRDRWLGGVAVGLAAALKLFPALLVLVFLRHRRYRAAAALIATVAGLNLLGMGIFGLGIAQVRGALDEAVAIWLPFDFNASIGAALNWTGVSAPTAGTLSWLVAGGLALAVLSRRLDFDIAFAGVLVLAILGSPLSWAHYDLMLIPFAALGWRKANSRLARSAIGVWVVIVGFGGIAYRLVFPDPASGLLTGVVAFVSRLVLLATFLFVGLSMREVSVGGGPTTTGSASWTSESVGIHTSDPERGC